MLVTGSRWKWLFCISCQHLSHNLADAHFGTKKNERLVCVSIKLMQTIYTGILNVLNCNNTFESICGCIDWVVSSKIMVIQNPKLHKLYLCSHLLLCIVDIEKTCQTEPNFWICGVWFLVPFVSFLFVCLFDFNLI